MQLEQIDWLHGLWAAAGLLGLLAWGASRASAAVARFFDPTLLARMAPGRSAARRVFKALLSCAALALVAVALARPQWNALPQEVRRSGRDVCFVIDVSRSMLAEDIAPNRLERAKLWVQDALRVAKGDRVAVVAFAGKAVVKCPLTQDYGFVRLVLDDLSPTSVSRGGTLIGDAIRTSLSEVFDDKEASFKDLILVTDGEDQGSYPVEAAKAAGAAGVRLIVIGIGDEERGRPIPITDPETGRQRLMTYEGKTVLTKLDGKTLREMAQATPGGQYFNVATGTIELDKVYERLVQQAQKREMASARAVRYEEKFQVFIAGALTLLVLERLIRERSRA